MKIREHAHLKSKSKFPVRIPYFMCGEEGHGVEAEDLGRHAGFANKEKKGTTGVDLAVAETVGNGKEREVTDCLFGEEMTETERIE